MIHEVEGFFPQQTVSSHYASLPLFSAKDCYLPGDFVARDEGRPM